MREAGSSATVAMIQVIIELYIATCRNCSTLCSTETVRCRRSICPSIATWKHMNNEYRLCPLTTNARQDYTDTMSGFVGNLAPQQEDALRKVYL